MEIDNHPMIQPSESIKLVLGAKGYRWEIKILDMDLDRLENIDKELKRRFNQDGNSNGNNSGEK